MSPDASAFGAAQARAFDQTEAHLETLAAEYDRVVRAAGVRAATAFSEFALTAAAGDPPWVVPALDDLIDVTRVTQELLGATEATRTQAAINATRPILSAMGVSFSLEAPMVKDLVSRTGVRAAALSIPGLQDAVRQAITTAFEQGLSVPQTAALIAQKANGLAAYQSEMLARTDLIGTANGGSLLAAKAVWPEQGTLLKRWTNATNSRTENDGHIRPTHLVANGQLVDIDERFLVGEDELLFPGDPGGSDAEVCNCRCSIVYEEPTTTATGWDESKHPRHHRGEHEGGRFAGKEPGTQVRPGYTPARYHGWHDGQMHELWDLWSDTGADAFSPTDNDADPALDSIANMQGFDGLPEVITEEELQRRVRDEGWSIYYRGVSEAKFADAFRNGDYYAGLGVQGNGIYITPVYAVAEEYAMSRAGERGGDGAVIRMIMRPDATKTSFANANQIKRAGHDALINDYRATLPPDLSDNQRKIRMNEAVGEGLIPGYRIQSNAGRVAAAEGFDAIDEGDVVTLLNRTAVAVVDEDYVPS